MKGLLSLGFASGLVALLAGCVSGPKLATDQDYVLEWIGERPLIDSSYLSITLGSDNRAFGSTGCNHWFAPYTLKGKHLTIGTPASTRKACAPALMEQEQRYLAALPRVKRWDVSKTGQIRLWPDQGAPLRFWPQE